MSLRYVGASVCGLMLMAAPATPALAAEPEQLGYLVVEPAKGDLTSAIDIATSDVCTRGQTFAVMMDGPNLKGTDRGNLLGTTKITTIGPESYPGHYVVPLPTDLGTYIATAAPGQRIRGDYTLTFACRDTLDTADLQVFTATIRIDGRGRYIAQGKSATPIEELIEGYVPNSAGFAYGDPVLPEAEPGADPAAASTTASANESSDSLPWRTILIAAGAVLLLGAGYAWWRERSRDRDDTATDQAATDQAATDQAATDQAATDHADDDSSAGVGS